MACPLHNWNIDLTNGCVREPDVGCTQKFSVKVENDSVHLMPVELATLALDFVPPTAGPKTEQTD